MNHIAIFVLASMPAGRVFGLDMQTFISICAQILNAVVLAVALSFLLYKPVREFMRKRADRIRNQIEEAEREKAEAEALKARYEDMLHNIDKERTEILDEARKLAAEQSRVIINEAREDAHAILKRASADAMLELDRAQSEIKYAIVEGSAMMAAKIITTAIDGQVQERLFNETLAELESVSWRT